MRGLLAPHRLSGPLLGALLLGTAAFAEAQAPSAWDRAWPRTDFSTSLVGLSEFRSGGPPKDGIPPIDEPRFRPAAERAAAEPGTAPVMSVEIAGDARAYPLAILMWHEIVNDVVGGRPIAVTYCPLCNSGAVFDRRVAGAVTSFGTTGMLRNSDLVMYDRTTESWWQQFDGRALVGKRAGVVLRRIPVRHETLASFASRHPDGRVLVPADRSMRRYGQNPYRRYDSSSHPFLYDGTYDGPGRPLMRVLSIEGRDEAWSLDLIRETAPIRTGDLVIEWQAGRNSALDTPAIVDGRDVGIVSVRRVNGAPVVHDLPFAFAFRAFHPQATIHHTY